MLTNRQHRVSGSEELAGGSSGQDSPGGNRIDGLLLRCNDQRNAESSFTAGQWAMRGVCQHIN